MPSSSGFGGQCSQVFLYCQKQQHQGRLKKSAVYQRLPLQIHSQHVKGDVQKAKVLALMPCSRMTRLNSE